MSLVKPIAALPASINTTCAGCLKAVLTWGALPLDLDLHVFSTAPPAGVTNTGWSAAVPAATHLYHSTSSPPAPMWGNVSLGPDVINGFGPEWATFGALTAVGRYSLAVDLFDQQAAGVTFASSNVTLGSIRLQIFNSSGLVAQLSPAAAVGSKMAWWVGNVTKTAQGFSFAAVNKPIV